MQRFWDFLLHSRTLVVWGFLALTALLLLGADLLNVSLLWVLAVFLGLLAIGLLMGGIQRWMIHRAGRRLGAAMDGEADRALQRASDEGRAELASVRQRMQRAIKTIKGSKMGFSSAALYELPWYAVMGNPAAGKSSAVVSSGLNFPFADKSEGVLQGIGCTRNCDWFFTTEGILLDTAGRYSVHSEDRGEWLGFLSLLKRHRPKAPLNGVIIAVSVAELSSKRPEFAIELARQLRQRVQDLTEKLEVFAPVYVVFTKADLIPGFFEFFGDQGEMDREKVWGATLRYDVSPQINVTELFDRHFDELREGLKEASLVKMSLQRGAELPPGVLSFPLEFSNLKATLRTFVAALFEENPYQFRPVFRGFYFTSALQEGQSHGQAAQRVAQRFGLLPREMSSKAVVAQKGFFLKELFSKVIFADRDLVQQYASPNKIRFRYAAFLAGTLLLGSSLAGWTWSYMNNRQLVANVQSDLGQVIRLQDRRIDLQSRMQALEVLQDRLEQLRRYRTHRPWRFGLGLYQGHELETKLRSEYMAGLQHVLLKPTAVALANYLGEVNSKADQLQLLGRHVETVQASARGDAVEDSSADVYVAASSSKVSDAYNALKAYIMLGERSRMESSHLEDQLTRFWRIWLEANRGAMPRDQMLRSAGRILSFALSEVNAADFPATGVNLALIDTTRESLRRVVKGMPAAERVYAEIKARAATRYAPVTVARLLEDADQDVVGGSYAIPGTFTKEAWQGFVDEAIQQASTKETQADDWVLKTALQDDLTLEGSPEQIRKTLLHLYKTEYVAEWRKFIQGVSVNSFESFDVAVARMNRLGDPLSSPVGRLIRAIHEQTSWDNPGLLDRQVAKGKQGFVAWFKESVLRMNPVRIEIKTDPLAGQALPSMGTIGKEFSGLGWLMAAADAGGPTLLRNYLQSLSRIRTRFNQIKNAGDVGPPSRQLMGQTLEGTSELAEALRLVDEQMLVNLSEAAKATLRPLLVRPLMQAFAVIVTPAEAEINRAWSAQVHHPFLTQLANKYPFTRSTQLEATPSEIAKIFGPEGAVAKFHEQQLLPLTIRRGDSLSSRTWAEMGLRLNPEFVAGFPNWVAPVSGGGGSSAPDGAAPTQAAAQATTQFQVLPTPSPTLSEVLLEIDGQQMRYRNATPSWTNFVWPSAQGTPGVRITGVDLDGRRIEFINAPGAYGLQRMLGSAKKRHLGNNSFELSWGHDSHVVSVQLRLISNADSGPSSPDGGMGNPPSMTGKVGGLSLPSVVAGDGASSALLMSPSLPGAAGQEGTP